MAITRASGQAAGTSIVNATSIARAYPGNVTNGNLLVIAAGKISQGATDAFVVGDVSKSAGTATVGTFTLDKADNYPDFYADWSDDTALFSVPVTGSGSCTISVTMSTESVFGGLGIVEYSGADTSASRVESTNAAHSSGTPSSGNATSASGAVFVGVACISDWEVTTVTQDALFSLIYEQEDAGTYCLFSAIERIVSGGTTDAASWTAPTDDYYGTCVAVYKEGAPAGAGLQQRRQGFVDNSPYTKVGNVRYF